MFNASNQTTATDIFSLEFYSDIRRAIRILPKHNRRIQSRAILSPRDPRPCKNNDLYRRYRRTNSNHHDNEHNSRCSLRSLKILLPPNRRNRRHSNWRLRTPYARRRPTLHVRAPENHKRNPPTINHLSLKPQLLPTHLSRPFRSQLFEHAEIAENGGYWQPAAFQRAELLSFTGSADGEEHESAC